MKKHRDSSDIKERIIAAAYERFMEEGFSGVPLEELAAGLGISKKTLYKHFRSKDELLDVVTDRLLEGVRAEFHAIVEGDADFLEKADALMSFLGQRLARFSRPMMRDLQRHSPQVWERVERFRRERIASDFKGLILRGVAGGFVRKDVDIDLFLMAFIAAVEAIVNPSVLARQSRSVQDVIRSVMTVFLRGILTAPASREFDSIRSHKAGHAFSQSPGVP